jgi:hypothetical protein
MKNQKKTSKEKFMAYVGIIAFGSIIFSNCSSSTDKEGSSSNDKCSDMVAYDMGYSEGIRNKNMLADCDYFWKMDNDGKMSKSCFCKGFNEGHNN